MDSHDARRRWAVSVSLALLIGQIGPGLAQAQELQLVPVSNFLNGLVAFLLGPVGVSIGIIIWLGTIIGFGATQVSFRRLAEVSLVEILYFGGSAIIKSLQTTAGGGQ